MIRANLLHLSYNMWSDWAHPEAHSPYQAAQPYLRLDEPFWNELIEAMAKAKFNMVVLDIGDAIRYGSHPEIAVEGAWPPDKLREELKKLRSMGLEPIPKLNFATTHDQWLGPYSRMVSTPQYYDVCRDLIKEVCQLFDKPRFFHLGMDEENAGLQKKYEYCVIRQYDLWWRDLKFLADQVESHGVRPWIWSDYVWDHQEEFYKRMPKTILQSNWHYRLDFTPDAPRVKEYIAMEKAGFDQVPTVSNWYTPESIPTAIEFCRKHISPQHLKGFLLTPWRPTLPETRDRHLEAIRRFSEALGR